MVLPATPPVIPTVLPLGPLTPAAAVAAVFALRVLRLEDDRCRREGVGWLGPDIRWLEFWSVASSSPVEADEAFDATEADCARRRESSRVRRLTTASCSFSSCMWRSAAVRGRGWRSGPNWYFISHTLQIS